MYACGSPPASAQKLNGLAQIIDMTDPAAADRRIRPHDPGQAGGTRSGPARP
jgi:hypothetical protein